VLISTSFLIHRAKGVRCLDGVAVTKYLNGRKILRLYGFPRPFLRT
jgi:hypothetical protein